jgi:hypothetical protein
MAVRNFLPLPNNEMVGIVTHGVKGLLNGDHAVFMVPSRALLRSVHISGVIGVGGSISIYGSNDIENDNQTASTPASLPTRYVILKNINGTALTFTAVGLEQIAQSTRIMAVQVTAGDGTTNLNAFFNFD